MDTRVLGKRLLQPRRGGQGNRFGNDQGIDAVGNGASPKTGIIVLILEPFVSLRYRAEHRLLKRAHQKEMNFDCQARFSSPGERRSTSHEDVATHG